MISADDSHEPWDSHWSEYQIRSRGGQARYNHHRVSAAMLVAMLCRATTTQRPWEHWMNLDLDEFWCVVTHGGSWSKDMIPWESSHLQEKGRWRTICRGLRVYTSYNTCTHDMYIIIHNHIHPIIHPIYPCMIHVWYDTRMILPMHFDCFSFSSGMIEKLRQAPAWHDGKTAVARNPCRRRCP